MALDDYSGLIRSGQAAVPDPTAAAVQQQLASAQVTGANLQNQQAQMQMAMAQRALVRQQQFSQQMQGFVRNPTAQGLASLTGNFPEFSAQAKEAWGPLNEAQRRQEATQMGEIATLAAGGNSDQAAKLFQDRIDADQKAGVERNPQQDQQILGMLKSGDPQQIKAVVAMTAAASGAAVGWDKAGEWLESLGLSKKPLDVGPGHSLVTQQGQTVASVAPELKDVSWTDAQGVTHPGWFNPQTGAMGNPGTTPGAPATGGGGQASGAGSTTPPPAGGGMQASIAHAMQNEGRPGNSYNPKDANGSPTNWGINWKANAAVLQKMGFTPANFKDMTQEQAAQIYATKYWPQSGAASLPANVQAPYFDVYIRNGNIAKQAWAQSGGDPQKFMQIANAKFQKMASNPNSGTAPYKNAWANRDAGNMALAAGSAPTQGGNQGGVPAQVGSPTFGPGSTPSAIPNTKNAETGFQWDQSTGTEVPIKGGSQDLPPQMVDDMARTLLETGQLPQGMGMGGAALKKAVFARRSEIMQESGITPEQLPQLQARNAADKTAYTNITGMASGLSASKTTLVGNLNQVWETQKPLIKEGILGNTPFLNEQRLKYYEQFGTSDQKKAIGAYRLAINGATTDYAKFMSTQTGMGNAPSTDSARNQASELLDEAQPMPVIRGNINQLMKEADIKENGVLQQKAALEHRLASYPWAPRVAQHSVGGQQVNIPPSAIQYLRANPSLTGAFDAKYGHGAAAHVLSGH